MNQIIPTPEYKGSPIEKYQPKVINKGWGRELIIHSSDLYCGKILCFNTGAESSNHLHLYKQESWMVLDNGVFLLEITNPQNADIINIELKAGDCFHLPNGLPHKLKCISAGRIMEVSNYDSSEDNIRIGKGDSQKI